MLHMLHALTGSVTLFKAGLRTLTLGFTISD